MNSEEIDLPFDNSPIIKVGVGLFDNISGIKVAYQWNFSESYILDQTELKTNDIFKTILTSVHRQDDKSYQNFVISKSEFPQDNLFIVSSIFLINLKQKNTYFSLGIILKASEMKNNIYLYSYLSSKIKSLTTILKNNIQESKPYSLITSNIKNCSIDISKLIFAMNKKKIVDTTNMKSNSDEKLHLTTNSEQNSTPKGISKSMSRRLILNEQFNLALENDTTCDFSEIEFSFLSILLTSHIQTQMTTIVECQNIKTAHSIATFLDRFLLPSQREMSSFEIRESPIPGLFLQFVHQQKNLRNKTIGLISRPTTWIRISDQSIDQIIPNSNIANNTPNNVKQISIKTPAPWVCKTVQLVQQAPVSMQKRICDIQMKDILWSATSYSIITQSKSQTQTQLLKPWTWQFFGDKSSDFSFTVLGSSSLSNEEDIKLIASISQLFYPDILFSKNT